MRTKIRVAVDVVVEIPDGWAGPPVRTVALDVLRRLCAPLEDGRFDQADSPAHVRSIAATVDGQTGWVVVPAGDEGRGQGCGQVSAPESRGAV